MFKASRTPGRWTLRSAILLAYCAAATAGCETAEGRPKAAEVARARTPVYVDSIRPIEDEIRRFRDSLDREPAMLSGGASSLDALAQAIVHAINTGDRTALAGLAVDRAEFAYFYYPHSPYTEPPYELSPALVWFQLTSRSSRGLTRLLQTFAHRELLVRGIRCAAEPEAAGEAVILAGCATLIQDADGQWVPMALFGRVMERDGRFKVLSYANAL